MEIESKIETSTNYFNYFYKIFFSRYYGQLNRIWLKNHFIVKDIWCLKDIQDIQMNFWRCVYKDYSLICRRRIVRIGPFFGKRIHIGESYAALLKVIKKKKCIFSTLKIKFAIFETT